MDDPSREVDVGVRPDGGTTAAAATGNTGDAEAVDGSAQHGGDSVSGTNHADESAAPGGHTDPTALGVIDPDRDLQVAGAMPLTVEMAGVDHARIERAVREILHAIGEDPERDGLQDTPARVARMYAETCSGLHEDPSHHLKVTFDAGHDEMILVRDIPVYSMCEHHLVPFFGRAHVGYIPNADGRVTGLSKLARLVDGFAKRPQVQERLTTQVADAIEAALDPRGVLVVITAEHLCMSMRGVRKAGSSTVTSAVRGVFRTDPAARMEAMRFVDRPD